MIRWFVFIHILGNGQRRELFNLIVYIAINSAAGAALPFLFALDEGLVPHDVATLALAIVVEALPAVEFVVLGERVFFDCLQHHVLYLVLRLAYALSRHVCLISFLIDD